ncbi:molybdopterin converting factor subunit 1 [Moraxella caviae]|uniref:Molybdopterin synthase sulfur carrier subunit n=1 Tax=Moraxella caviae TaxID=34060 RepID=A0A1T0A5X1_9GAMM|nr:molybdopterin converting factor subunit 1 [Moraxella caviae]OOR91087.1 molybdopterin converting factor subunit 1 [Moraxella caviae]STZ14217.1 Sulfur carrier protein moaD [Moraxella caviae]VEW13153.1 Sulfur carrier protein moaD [Moraxella caviae]
MPNNEQANELRISVLYFASLAQAAQTDEEVLTVPSDDLGEIYDVLSAKYGFDLPKDKLAVAINHHFVTWQTKVQANDVVAFIPPVAGG